MNQLNYTPKELLDRHNIVYTERGEELILHCLFNDCDADSRPNEAHLYVSSQTGQYHCKKCSASGNLTVLAKQLGETIEKIAKPVAKTQLTEEIIEDCNTNLPVTERAWLNARGITDDSIEDYKLGYGKYYGKYWITIPVRDTSGEPLFFKLRRLPADDDNPKSPNKYMFWPKGSTSALFNVHSVAKDETLLLICEGEFDCIIAQQNGFPAVTSTAGAGTFNIDWLKAHRKLEKVYVAFDIDEAGDNGTKALVEKLNASYSGISIYKTTLPNELGEGADITDYFVHNNGSPDDLIGILSTLVAGLQPIDTSKFEQMSLEDVLDVLGLTIKNDNDNKLVTFLCLLSAYTEDSQLNLSFNAPSSSGKSFLPIEIARLFPQEDVLELGYVSPTSFFHSASEFNKETHEYLVDLSSKIIVFLDQPHTMLLEHLRPLLSHDKKEIKVQITDKGQKHGLRAKKIVLRGYPSVVFCSAGLRLDEQEATRFLLLSPEISQEKIRAGIIESLKKSANSQSYKDILDADPGRILLKERIIAIKRAGITDIRIEDEATILEQFFASRKMLKPGHQRDIKRLVSLIKVLTLLNLWWREQDGTVIIATAEDVRTAFSLWERISLTQELNIPPYLYQLFVDVILAAFNDKNGDRSAGFLDATGALGVSRQELLKKHFEVFGRPLDSTQLRQQILPMLTQAGLISEEVDPSDKRQKLIYPLLDPNNSESSGGVIDKLIKEGEL